MGGIRVPIVEQQVRDNGLPGYQQNIGVSGAAFGTDIGQGISQTAQALGGIAAQEQEKANSAAVMNAYAQSTKKRLEIEGQFRALKGQNALAARDGAQKMLEAQLDNIGGALSNDAQREQWQRIRSEQVNGFSSSADSHVIQQADELHHEAFAGATQAAADSAVAHAAVGSMDAVAEDVQKIRDATQTFARQQGVDPEWIAKPTLSAAHSGVIGSLVQGNNIDAAKNYLEKHGAEMRPQDQKSAEVAIDNQSRRLTAFSVSDDIIKSSTVQSSVNGVDQPATFDLDIALQQLDKNEDLRRDPKAYDAARKRIVDRAHDINEAAEAHDAPLMGSLLTEAMQSNSPVDQTDPRFLALSDAHQAHLLGQDEANQRAEETLQNTKTETALHILQQMAPADVRAMNLRTNPITKDLWSKGIDMLEAYQGHLEREAGVPAEAFNALVKAALQEDEVTNPKDIARYTQRYNAFYWQWRSDPHNQGTVPPASLMKTWHDQITAEDVTKHEAFGITYWPPTRTKRYKLRQHEIDAAAKENPAAGAPPPSAPLAPPAGPSASSLPPAGGRREPVSTTVTGSSVLAQAGAGGSGYTSIDQVDPTLVRGLYKAWAKFHKEEPTADDILRLANKSRGAKK